MKTAVRDTSVESFYIIKDLGDRQRAVYSVIESMGTACNLDIAYKLQIPINRITPRTNELVKIGAVEVSHKAISSLTGRKVIYWKTV